MARDSEDSASVQAVLERALRAPSAHNAQPWRLSPQGKGSYLLWYAFADRLLADPDDRDGIMAMGGFYETLSLAADAEGMAAEFSFAWREGALGIELGTVSLSRRAGDPDPLSRALAGRQCNRNPYSTSPLPPALLKELEALGHILLEPGRISELVQRASVMAWKDSRFVSDLAEWTRFDELSPDGMTVDCLRLSRLDQRALKFALHRGRLPAPIARLYAERDVRLTRASSKMAVLTAGDRTPETLFDCGRKLVRAWTLINSLGYSWHPMSIVIDQPTVEQLRQEIGGADPVAIYRVGFTEAPAAWSHRRRLPSILADTAG